MKNHKDFGEIVLEAERGQDMNHEQEIKYSVSDNLCSSEIKRGSQMDEIKYSFSPPPCQ